MTSLQTAYQQWLTVFESSRLPLAFQKMLESLDAAVAEFTAGTTSPEEAWNAHSRLQRMAEQLRDPMPAAQVWLGLGKAAEQLGHHDLARAMIEKGLERSQPNRHARAVALWMLGVVLWKIPAGQEQAIRCWQDALNGFELLSCEPFDVHAAWYKTACVEMSQAIERVLERAASGARTQQPAQTINGRAQAANTGSSRIANRNPASRLAPGWIDGFPLAGAVQAGGFATIKPQAGNQACLEIRSVVIQDQAFAIYSPYQDERVLSLAGDDRVFTLQVVGDSMDRTIQPGDYVLVQRQSTAASGDIVVAAIRGIDACATLKRYHVAGDGTIQLRPDSNNTDHQAFQARGENQGYTILGKVIAIFQPIADQAIQS